MKGRSALAGSLFAAVLASACCLLPLIAGVLGGGSLGAAAALAPLRPWLLLLTAVLLGLGFYFAYRPVRQTACDPDGSCSASPSRTGQRVILWVVTVLAVDLATYPTWADRPISRHPAGPAWGGSQAVVVLAVDGMTCSAWEGEIAHELVSAPGVRTATVSFKAGRATVATERNVPTEELTAAVTRAGYRARVLAR